MQSEGEHKVCLRVGAGIALGSVGLARKPWRHCRFIDRQRENRNMNLKIKNKKQLKIGE